MLLNDRITLITGAARGIGYATAELFACHGATVIMADKDEGQLEYARQKLIDSHPRLPVHTSVCDVSDVTSVRATFEAIFKKFKRLDVLVSNAGVLGDGLIGMVSSNQLKSTFETNTFGVIYCAQYASRLMSRRNYGTIINVSSIMGTNGNEGQTVYAASKAAVVGITKSLAKELARENVRVNAVAPGFIDTDLAHSITPEKFQERINSIKMGRIGSPDEVARVILFLASDLADYVTGQIIGVDGGMLI